MGLPNWSKISAIHRRLPNQMRHLKDSILKRWHTIAISPQKCSQKWTQPYWEIDGAYQNIACRNCPEFDPQKAQCSISFGTPLRKCVVASIEAHFNDCAGLDYLEIGFGRFKLAKNLILRSGGTWTGIDPAQPTEKKAQKGKGGYGVAAGIPFPDQSFDRVFGIQSFEHWGQRAAPGREPSDYAECLREVARVLRPGGSVYFDVPIHFHGHEMFIMGDLPRIESLFKAEPWGEVQLQYWRRDYQPLEIYPPNKTVLKEWPIEILSYPPDQVSATQASASVWLLAITARKAA